MKCRSRSELSVARNKASGWLASGRGARQVPENWAKEKRQEMEGSQARQGKGGWERESRAKWTHRPLQEVCLS